MSIILVKPSIKYEASLLKYKDAFDKGNEFLHGTSNISNYRNMQEWIEYCSSMEHRNTCPKNFVPAYQFLLVNIETDEVIGMINCRLELNDYLFKEGGHIGYSIHPQFRRKGMAKLQLKYALDIYKELGFNRVLITCDKDNIASSKTIRSLSGQLENEVIIDDGTIVERFWIALA